MLWGREWYTERSRPEKEEDFAPKGLCPSRESRETPLREERSPQQRLGWLSQAGDLPQPSAGLSNHREEEALQASQKTGGRRVPRGEEHEGWKQCRPCGPLHRFIYKNPHT